MDRILTRIGLALILAYAGLMYTSFLFPDHAAPLVIHSPSLWEKVTGSTQVIPNAPTPLLTPPLIAGGLLFSLGIAVAMVDLGSMIFGVIVCFVLFAFGRPPVPGTVFAIMFVAIMLHRLYYLLDGNRSVSGLIGVFGRGPTPTVSTAAGPAAVPRPMAPPPSGTRPPSEH